MAKKKNTLEIGCTAISVAVMRRRYVKFTQLMQTRLLTGAVASRHTTQRSKLFALSAGGLVHVKIWLSKEVSNDQI